LRRDVIAHAIEWSLAIPKTSPFFPLNKPIRDAPNPAETNHPQTLRRGI
jgi:hypothetical protein